MDHWPFPATEAHVGDELTQGKRTYFTTVTLFQGKPASYSTRMP